jgi:hypothetical protein
MEGPGVMLGPSSFASAGCAAALARLLIANQRIGEEIEKVPKAGGPGRPSKITPQAGKNKAGRAALFRWRPGGLIWARVTSARCKMLDGMEGHFMRTLPIIVVCLFLSAGFGHAQTQNDGKLKGLTQINLIVEDLTKDSQACGITPELIRSAFMYPASSSNLKTKIEEEPLRIPIFYIQVSTLHGVSGLCFSDVIVKVYINQTLKLPFANRDGFYEVDLWHENWVVFSPVNRHAQMIKEQIENITKAFLTAWNLDNKPQ